MWQQILKGGPVHAFAQAKATEFMTASLGGNQKLCDALIPKSPLGFRRLTPAPGYLEALQAPNVEVVTEKMTSVLPEGIQLGSGEIVKLDVIICATGFDNSFVPRFPIFGRGGNVQDAVRKGKPRSYMSCALPSVPNYFSEPPDAAVHSFAYSSNAPAAFLGPNAPIGHGSIFTLSEHIARYITRVMVKCQQEGIKAIAPSDGAVDDYTEHIATFMPRTAWASHGRSWFKGGTDDGPVTALHPGSRVHFFHMLDSLRGEDWDYVFDGLSQNRFGYLGNGFSAKELDPAIDSTWYLNESVSAKL